MLQDESACLFCAYMALFVLRNLITIHAHRLLYFVIYDVHIPLYQGKLLDSLCVFHCLPKTTEQITHCLKWENELPQRCGHVHFLSKV